MVTREVDFTHVDEHFNARFDARVGSRVRQLRKAAGVTQTELADQLTKLGLSFHQPKLVQVEQGRRSLKFEEAQAIAQILGVDVSLLIYGAEDAAVAAVQEQRQDALREIANCHHQIADLEQRIDY